MRNLFVTKYAMAIRLSIVVFRFRVTADTVQHRLTDKETIDNYTLCRNLETIDGRKINEPVRLPCTNIVFSTSPDSLQCS